MEEQKNNIENNEVTLKEVILFIQEYVMEVFRNWKLVFIIPIPFIAYMFYKTYSAPKTYPASLTFMVNDDSGGGGGIGVLAATFGLGRGVGGEYNLDKILSLLKSRNIVQKALFEKSEYLGKEDYYANHIIHEYDYHEKWIENDSLKDFIFTSNKLEEFSRKENSALKQLYAKVVGNKNVEGILTSEIDDDTGILTMILNCTNEQLSIKFLLVLFEKLEKFYVDKTIEKQQKTFIIMSQKVDSIRQTLNAEQYRLLRFTDTNKNLSLRQFAAEELVLQREIHALGLAYAEALKNQEIADFSLRSKTPFIQVIDNPISPIRPSKSMMTYIRNIIIGGILGGFLAVAFILGRKIYRDTMKE